MIQNSLPIFIQLAETIRDKILSGEYKEDERIPSARDLAIEVEVNPNTVVKAFDELQREDVIYNKRGMGYFVSPGAKEKILTIRLARLQKELIPTLRRESQLLGLSEEELIQMILQS